MRIFLNSEPREVADGTLLPLLLEENGLAGGNRAVAVNMAVIPRSRLPAVILREGDRVEVIEAVGGG